MLLLHYTGLRAARPSTGCRVPRARCPVRLRGSMRRARSRRWWPRIMRAWHAGPRQLGAARRDINSASVGIEIHNPGHDLGYPEFPEAQLLALEALCADIIARHRIRPERVLAHSDVAPTRKKDPGEKFPWARLAGTGIGHWVPPEPVTAPIRALPGCSRSLVADVQGMLRALRLRHRADRRLRSADRVRGHRLPAPLPPRARRRPHRPVDHHHAGAAGRGAALTRGGRLTQLSQHVARRRRFAPADRLDARASWCCSPAAPAGASTSRPSRSPTPAFRRSCRRAALALGRPRWFSQARLRGVRLFERDGTLWPGLLAGLGVRAGVPDPLCRARPDEASRGVVFLYPRPFVVAFGAHYLIPATG